MGRETGKCLPVAALHRPTPTTSPQSLSLSLSLCPFHSLQRARDTYRPFFFLFFRASPCKPGGSSDGGRGLERNYT